MQSIRLVQKVVRFASWAYLFLVHVVLLRQGEYVTKFRSCCFSVMYAPSKLKYFDREPSADEKSTCCENVKERCIKGGGINFAHDQQAQKIKDAAFADTTLA